LLYYTTSIKYKRAQIRREEEEKFYRGENVSWWNFVFPDHVLKRDVHVQLKRKIKEALEGKQADEDNKIGLVNIYHQNFEVNKVVLYFFL
jgi:hypothetical protein